LYLPSGSSKGVELKLSYLIKKLDYRKENRT
jgi:hypothetical protein